MGVSVEVVRDMGAVELLAAEMVDQVYQLVAGQFVWMGTLVKK